MERFYDSEIDSEEVVKFFTGKEVEQTPAFGMQTLFVVGLQSILDIDQKITEDIDHIFFGANQSFYPAAVAGNWDKWQETIMYFLARGWYCSLDIPNSMAEQVMKSELNECPTFIPQITVEIPSVEKWNENTMIKIDDVGFNKTNPGVWCHSLNSLQSPLKFTPWEAYLKDKVIKDDV